MHTIRMLSEIWPHEERGLALGIRHSVADFLVIFQKRARYVTPPS
jgi:hypothetical protein